MSTDASSTTTHGWTGSGSLFTHWAIGGPNKRMRNGIQRERGILDRLKGGTGFISLRGGTGSRTCLETSQARVATGGSMPDSCRNVKGFAYKSTRSPPLR